MQIFSCDTDAQSEPIHAFLLLMQPASWSIQFSEQNIPTKLLRTTEAAASGVEMNFLSPVKAYLLVS